MYYKKTIVLTTLVCLSLSLSAFLPKKAEETKFKNLKVLPKNISKEDLDKVMDNFKMALGVRCGFCHAPMKDNPKKMDFASDEKQEKETARKMMQMTAKINKKYFHETMKEGKTLAQIACITCHNGKTEPAN
ncbi:c-type cytochrome [Pedobacter sandarakinus]|uniref:c-type cytochrome n=1 Tax=Pedobacter sandarakinus TaxID=353156 RepID=UPI0022481A64|nr:c-type cytochrome [Pedobacter sandarakinus]MCX2575116.1 c-type cytochrome [Pedobacter sandarakinus]